MTTTELSSLNALLPRTGTNLVTNNPLVEPILIDGATRWVCIRSRPLPLNSLTCREDETVDICRCDQRERVYPVRSTLAVENGVASDRQSLLSVPAATPRGFIADAAFIDKDEFAWVVNFIEACSVECALALAGSCRFKC